MKLTQCFLIVWMLMVILAAAVLATQTSSVRGNRAALLIIDVQDCFMPPSGSLAVSKGDEVIPVINELRKNFDDKFSLVVISQDWHCADHVSFASQHPGFQAYAQINLTYNANGELCQGDSVPASFTHAVDCDANDDGLKVVGQRLWPDHCIQNVTSGALSPAITSSLTVKDTDVIVKKGYNCGGLFSPGLDLNKSWREHPTNKEIYAFFDNGGFRQTELNDLLKQHNIDLVVVTGLALDYCVYYTSKDAHELGYKVLTVTDACRGVAPASTEAAVEDLRKTGVELVLAADLEGALQDASQAYQPGTMSAFLLVAVGALFTAYFLLKS